MNIKEFAQKIHHNGLTSVVAPCGHGKTRFSVWLAGVCSMEGGILYISSEQNAQQIMKIFETFFLNNRHIKKYWVQKSRKIKLDRVKNKYSSPSNFSPPGIKILQSGDLKHVRRVLDEGYYSMLFLDSLGSFQDSSYKDEDKFIGHRNKMIQRFLEEMRYKNISTVISDNTIRTPDSNLGVFNATNSRITMISDSVIKLEKHDTYVEGMFLKDRSGLNIPKFTFDHVNLTL